MVIKATEPPDKTKKSWWKKHKDEIIVWTSIGSFILSLLQFLTQIILHLKK